MRQNLHTHTIYCDGKDTPEEMVQTAIEKGFSILGFSGHGYVKIDDAAMSPDNTSAYIKEILRLKKKYTGIIEIYLGIEEDMLGRLKEKKPYEFVIGSCHFLECNGQFLPIDYNQGVLEYMNEVWFSGNFRNLAKIYYAELRKMRNWGEVDIIGHLDLITKYNEDESFISFHDPVYVSEATDTIDALKGKIFEVNTGAIARGYRRSPYPYKNLLEYMHAAGARIMLNSDCHNRQYLDCAFHESIDLIKNCGFTAMMKKTKNGFEETDINEFE